MPSHARYFAAIADEMVAGHDDVEHGTMMRSPALTRGGKVFCFFWEDRDRMVFKLGKDANTDRPELAGWEWLNPFKRKGPVKGWYAVPFARQRAWLTLAGDALEAARAGRG